MLVVLRCFLLTLSKADTDLPAFPISGRAVPDVEFVIHTDDRPPETKTQSRWVVGWVQFQYQKNSSKHSVSTVQYSISNGVQYRNAISAYK